MNWDSASDVEAAGKTGTTNKNKVGWFCGYTPYYTISVYVAYDDQRATKKIWGHSYPAKVWKEAMLFMTEGLDAKDFDLAARIRFMILMTPIPVHLQRTTQQIRLIRRRIIQIKAIRIITTIQVLMEIFLLRRMVSMEAIFRILPIPIPEIIRAAIQAILPVTIKEIVLVTIRVEVPAILLAVPQQMTAIQPVQTRISKLDGEGNGR